MLYKKKWPALLFVLPGLLFLLIFLYLPFLENIRNSLYNMKAVVELPGSAWKFIGLKNYRRLLWDPDLRTAIGNTLKMMALTVVFEVGFAFVLAVLVSNVKRL